MRTLLLATTFLVVAACSDNPQPTGPRSASSRGTSAGDLAPAAHPVAQASGKPVDPVGFTKITRVLSVNKSLPPGAIDQVTATCPPGTTVIGGGFATAGGLPIIIKSMDNSSNGWVLIAQNLENAQNSLSIGAVAYCAS